MNNTTLVLKAANGIGDKIINLLGAAVYCYYKKFELKTSFNEILSFYAFGSYNCYDLSLFNFINMCVYDKSQDVNHFDDGKTFRFHNPDIITSITPYAIYQKLKNEGFDNITFLEVSNMFIKFAKNIQPSDYISKYIPVGIENAYGIHLRKSDKVLDSPDVRHETSYDEHSTLLSKLKIFIEDVIEKEDNPKFFIASEDNENKKQFVDLINNKATSLNKVVKILNIEENIPENITSKHNFNTVLDLFCLSKCKSIVQGIKYSGFSVVASLIGNEKIINFSKYLDTDHLNIIYLWNSSLYINDNKNIDENKYLTLINKYKEMNMFCGDTYITHINGDTRVTNL
jgi:hypothetical protein